MSLTSEEREAIKDAIKQAHHEFLNEKFAEFGKWSFYGIMACAIAMLGYAFAMAEIIKK